MFRCCGSGRLKSNNDIDLETDQLTRQGGKETYLSARRPEFK